MHVHKHLGTHPGDSFEALCTLVATQAQQIERYVNLIASFGGLNSGQVFPMGELAEPEDGKTQQRDGGTEGPT